MVVFSEPIYVKGMIMGICFDNPMGNSGLNLVSGGSGGTDGTEKKTSGEPASFLSLFQKALDSGELSGALPNQSQSAKTQKALEICHRMKQEMNESLLRTMSDTEGENKVQDPLMDDLSAILSREKMGQASLSTIRHTPSEIEPPTIQAPRIQAPGIQVSDLVDEKIEKIEKDLSSSGIDGIIQKASKAYGVDVELIRKVVQAESSFNSSAVSSKGAMGLMQLMPQTAKELGVTDPMDPTQNIMGGTRYLKKLLDRYDGSVPLALAAYNWGMGNLDSRRSSMPAETKAYVAKITGNAFA